MLSLSDNGAKFIAECEGFSSIPYQDIVGVWTIGNGTTTYPDGRKVCSTDASCTPEQAANYLKAFVNSKALPALLKVVVPLTQNEVDALSSFIYNLGAGAFESSTLVKKLNLGDKVGAANEFPRWNKAGGKEVTGLTTRRLKEKELFLNGTY